MSHHIPLLGIKPTLPTDLPMPIAILANDHGECTAVMPGHGSADIEYRDFDALQDAHGLDYGAHLDAIGAPSPEDFDTF